MTIGLKLDSIIVGYNTSLKSIKLFIKSYGILPLTSVGIVLLYEYSRIRMDDNHVILYEIELNGQMFRLL